MVVAGTTGGESGAAAVEFSLIATLLFALLFGILQFGLAYNRQQGVQAAAREGARLASLGGSVTEAEVIARVRAAAPAFILDPANDLTVTVEDSDSVGSWCDGVGPGGSQGTQERVTVSVALAASAQSKYEVSLPIIASFLPNLSATASFLCESPRTP